jgi:CheY-like chemotaxis protein
VNQQTQNSIPGILVVEDDDLLRRSLVTYLSSLGYRAIGASSSEEALVLASRTELSAVVTDFHLPAMNGIELVRALSRPGGRHLQAVLMSGLLDAAILKAARELGIPAVLSKPEGLPALGATLQNLIGAPRR